ncbi:MAG: hypothetical protein ABEJ99_05395 [Candidatus Nanohaloarchaea archaeon]
MKVTVNPNGNIEQLKENLEKRVDNIKERDGRLEIETDSLKTIRKTPGIESFEHEGEKEEGLKGKPVSKEVYARIDSEKDAVKALLATIQGYDLRVLNSSREWDLRRLREYNPDIKHLKFDEPREEFGIERSISNVDGVEKVDIEMPGEEEQELIYREMLT